MSINDYDVQFNIYSNSDSSSYNDINWRTTTTASSTGITYYPTTDEYTYNTTSSWTIPKFPWLDIKDPIGIIYVEDDKIKLKTQENEEIVIIDLNKDDNSKSNLLAIVAKKKLESLENH